MSCYQKFSLVQIIPNRKDRSPARSQQVLAGIGFFLGDAVGIGRSQQVACFVEIINVALYTHQPFILLCLLENAPAKGRICPFSANRACAFLLKQMEDFQAILDVHTALFITASEQVSILKQGCKPAGKRAATIIPAVQQHHRQPWMQGQGTNLSADICQCSFCINSSQLYKKLASLIYLAFTRRIEPG